jgi:hypothetical protein
MVTPVVTLCEVPLDQVLVDDGVLPRQVDPALLDDYAARLRAGDRFPPIRCGKLPGGRLLLLDGRHRLEAHRWLCRPCIAAEVATIMDRRQAYLLALAGNRQHGRRLSSGELRRAIERLLADQEWRTWTDIGIARLLGCSGAYVGEIRRVVGAQAATRVYTKANGTLVTMTVTGPTVRTRTIESAVANGGLSGKRATKLAGNLITGALTAIELLLPLSPQALAATLDEHDRWDELEGASQRLVGLVAAASGYRMIPPE